MFTILIFLKAVTVAWICAESQTFKFFGFFKQRNILNKSYFNTEIVGNCLIAKEKNHLSFLFCGQYRDWKCLVTLSAVSLKDSSLLWQLPRDLCHSPEASEPQHHLSCADDSSLCLDRRLSLEELVWHFCEAGKDYITQRNMHNMEAWAEVCR